MRSTYLAVSYIVLALFMASCKPSVDPQDANGATVITTITGLVLDESGKVVDGARVAGHGATTTTNSNGVFVLKNVRVPSDRCVVLVHKGGYFTGARAAYPVAGKFTSLRITMQEATTVFSTPSGTGGTFSVSGASVALPQNGYVDANGNTYAGTVNAAARYLDPADRNFYQSFSGDMAALREDGSRAELESYGVLRVQLTGASGQALQLASGATATLTFPSAGASLAEIPLWHFDEGKSIWVEDGKAVRTGGTYVGTVSHFTDWNLDVPNARFAILEGRVTCAEGKPLAGIMVDIGQVTAITDEDGVYRRRVPADATFTVRVRAERNNGISSADASVGPLAQNETKVLDISVSPCPTVLEFSLVDCNDQPIGGFVQIVTPAGIRAAASSTGAFRVIVPGATALTVEGFSLDARSIESTPVAAIAIGTTFNAGQIKACSGVETAYLDIQLPANQQYIGVVLNNEGDKVAAVSVDGVALYDVTTGDLLWSKTIPGKRFNELIAVKFVAAYSRLAVSSYDGTHILDAATGAVISSVEATGRQHVSDDGNFVYVFHDSGSVWLQEYDGTSGAIGRKIALVGAQQEIQFYGLQGNSNAVTFGYGTTNRIVVWDLSNGTEVRGIDLASPRSSGASLSPSGKVLAVMQSPGGAIGALVFFDLTTGLEIPSSISQVTQPRAIAPNDVEYVSYDAESPLPVTRDIATRAVRMVLPSAFALNTTVMFGYSGNSKKLAGLNMKNSPQTTSNTVRVYTLR